MAVVGHADRLRLVAPPDRHQDRADSFCRGSSLGEGFGMARPWDPLPLPRDADLDERPLTLVLGALSIDGNASNSISPVSIASSSALRTEVRRCANTASAALFLTDK